MIVAQVQCSLKLLNLLITWSCGNGMARPRHGDASKAKALPKALGLAVWNASNMFNPGKWPKKFKKCISILVRRDQTLPQPRFAVQVPAWNSQNKSQVLCWRLGIFSVHLHWCNLQLATASLKKISGSNIRSCNFSPSRSYKYILDLFFGVQPTSCPT